MALLVKFRTTLLTSKDEVPDNSLACCELKPNCHQVDSVAPVLDHSGESSHVRSFCSNLLMLTGFEM